MTPYWKESDGKSHMKGTCTGRCILRRKRTPYRCCHPHFETKTDRHPQDDRSSKRPVPTSYSAKAFHSHTSCIHPCGTKPAYGPHGSALRMPSSILAGRRLCYGRMVRRTDHPTEQDDRRHAPRNGTSRVHENLRCHAQELVLAWHASPGRGLLQDLP